MKGSVLMFKNKMGLTLLDRIKLFFQVKRLK